jgi:hypothetical protein
LVLAIVPSIKSADASSAGASYPFYPQTQGSYTPEAIFDIGGIAHTMEHLAVAFMAAGIKSPALNLQGNALLLATVQAALLEEQLHVHFLARAIARPFTGLSAPPFPGFFVNINGQPVAFTVPKPAMLTDLQTFLATLEQFEELFVAVYTAAVREFAELGQPQLAKQAAQLLGVEAEHRALVRAAMAIAGVAAAVPPNNKAFETDYLLYVRDIVGILVQLGFFNGSGTPLAELEDAEVGAAAGPMAKAVIQQTPNNAASTDISTLPGQRA